jgi:TolB-like protein
MFSRSRLLNFLLLLSCLSLFSGCVLPTHKRLMVMDFANATGEMQLDKLSKAIPEYIITHMSSYPGIIFVEHQEVNLYIDEQGWQQDSALKGLKGWQALGRRLDVDYLVVGSVSKLGEDNFTIAARLYSVQLGQNMPGSAFSRSCRSEEDLFLLSKVIADSLRDHLQRRQPQTIGGNFP